MTPKYVHPGIYVEKVFLRKRVIQTVSTSITAFVGFFSQGPVNKPMRVISFADFVQHFGGLHENSETSYSIQQYFLNGGQDAYVVRAPDSHENLGLAMADEATGSGLYALELLSSAGFNLLSMPDVANLPEPVMQTVYDKAIEYCREKNAFLIIDIPESVDSSALMLKWLTDNSGFRDENATVYFPRIIIADERNNYASRNIASSGTLCGIYARNDSERGVWKAPAGMKADIRSAKPVTGLTDQENGQLNSQGINGLRTFPDRGHFVWGARTLKGADYFTHEYKYIPVRRLSLFIGQSLYKGLHWIIFEQNGEPLWLQIRLNAREFLHALFRKGAFQGSAATDAYFVKCDHETMSQSDIDQGIINIMVGFAPLKPAEFIIMNLQFKTQTTEFQGRNT